MDCDRTGRQQTPWPPTTPHDWDSVPPGVFLCNFSLKYIIAHFFIFKFFVRQGQEVSWGSARWRLPPRGGTAGPRATSLAVCCSHFASLHPCPLPAPAECSRACSHTPEVTGPLGSHDPTVALLPPSPGTPRSRCEVRTRALQSPRPTPSLPAERREQGADGAPGAAAWSGGPRGPQLGPPVPAAACKGQDCPPQLCSQQPACRPAGRVGLEGPQLSGKWASTPRCRSSKAVLVSSGRAPPLSPHRKCGQGKVELLTGSLSSFVPGCVTTWTLGQARLDRTQGIRFPPLPECGF